MKHTLGESLALKDFLARFVPEYNVTYRPFLAKVLWSHDYGERIRALNPKRAHTRIASYLDDLELDRVRAKLRTKEGASIRFGAGQGYLGECGLVGGTLRGEHLALFYRRFELIGGFAYDVVLIDHLAKELNRRFRSVTFHAVQADVFALSGNSNERLLLPKLREIFS